MAAYIVQDWLGSVCSSSFSILDFGGKVSIIWALRIGQPDICQLSVPQDNVRRRRGRVLDLSTTHIRRCDQSGTEDPCVAAHQRSPERRIPSDRELNYPAASYAFSVRIVARFSTGSRIGHGPPHQTRAGLLRDRGSLRLSSKKPEGISATLCHTVFRTGQSSGRGRWWKPIVYHNTVSAFSTGRCRTTNAGGGGWTGSAPAPRRCSPRSAPISMPESRRCLFRNAWPRPPRGAKSSGKPATQRVRSD